MTTENLTPEAKNVITRAVQESAKRHYNLVSSEHLLLAALSIYNNTIFHTLEVYGLELSTAYKAVEEAMIVPATVQMAPRQPYDSVTPLFIRIVKNARDEAEKTKDFDAGPEHLLLSLCRSRNSGSSKLLALLFRIRYPTLLKIIQRIKNTQGF
jgi:ATP-dependent Clp protease ATP-binding subunit ClpA